MSDQSNTTSRISLLALANYDIHYADEIILLCDTLAEDERKTWSFVNADGPATEDILTVTTRRISLLKERYFQLKRTSNNLLLIAQVWMHDASTHTQKQDEVRGSGLGEQNTLCGVCYAFVSSSVQTLSAMLQEIDQHRDSINKEFIQSDDPVSEQVNPMFADRLRRSRSTPPRNAANTPRRCSGRSPKTPQRTSPTKSARLQTLKEAMRMLAQKTEELSDAIKELQRDRDDENYDAKNHD